MVDYDFYASSYLGSSIPIDQFDRLAQRAEEQLCRLGRLYRVSAPAGSSNARENALCAMADALYYYETAQANGGAASVSIGSVSTGVAPGAQPDLTPKAQAAELRRCAGLYLALERWCGPCCE